MKKQFEKFVEVENRLKDKIEKFCNERDNLKEKVDKSRIRFKKTDENEANSKLNSEMMMK